MITFFEKLIYGTYKNRYLRYFDFLNILNIIFKKCAHLKNIFFNITLTLHTKLSWSNLNPDRFELNILTHIESLIWVRTRIITLIFLVESKITEDHGIGQTNNVFKNIL